MVIAGLMLIIVLLVATLVLREKHNADERNRLISALLAEKAPTFTRIETRKQELEAFASIEDDDEGDMPDGLV